MALATWKDYLADCDVLVFIDNDPARDALVHSSSSADVSTEFVTACRMICAEKAIAQWYARVASPSNVADWLSRGKFESLLRAGALWREPSRIDCEPLLGLYDFCRTSC